MTDNEAMEHALVEAELSRDRGEVPVGAVAIHDSRIIARAHNSPISHCDPTAHAEILLLRHAASYLGAYRLPGLTVYVTLEPCLMCFGALLHARVYRLVYGADDPKVGFSRAYSLVRDEGFFNHEIAIDSGVLADRSVELLRTFFRERRPGG
jgi:tRNA(adenine34) deaminase